MRVKKQFFSPLSLPTRRGEFRRGEGGKAPKERVRAEYKKKERERARELKQGAAGDAPGGVRSARARRVSSLALFPHCLLFFRSRAPTPLERPHSLIYTAYNCVSLFVFALASTFSFLRRAHRLARAGERESTLNVCVYKRSFSPSFFLSSFALMP